MVSYLNEWNGHSGRVVSPNVPGGAVREGASTRIGASDEDGERGLQTMGPVGSSKSLPLHFLHVFPNFAPGGMELRVARIINGLNIEVRHTVLALFGNYEARASLNSAIQVRFLEPPPRKGHFAYIWALQKLLRRERPDLLLTYNWAATDVVLAAFAMPSCPLVHHECGFGAEESEKLKASHVLARRILLRRAFAVAVTSKTLREISICEFKVPAERVRWIRTGIDLQRFRPGMSRDWRRQIGVHDDELLFGFVGGLRPEKNLPLLIRAFAGTGLRHARLVLVGDGPERQRLEQLARDEGVAERVVFAGRVEDPSACLPALDIFALASSTEQTSNALLEAMACGLPSVSTDVGDGAEILGDLGPPVVVPSGDLRAYTSALKTLADSSELRQRLGAANRQRCVEHHPLAGMVREYEALYISACRRARPQ